MTQKKSNRVFTPKEQRLPTPAQRTRAVLRLYNSRTSAPTATQKTYTAYLVALSALIIGGPAFSLTRNITQQWLAESTNTTVQAVLLAALFAVPLLAFATGKFAGPFTSNTFVMRVLTSTNIQPRTYLSRIAAPRLIVVALCTAMLASGIIYAIGQQIPESWNPLQLTLTSLATAASTAGSWVLAQIAEGPSRLLVVTLVLVAGIAAVALGATKALPIAWLLAAVIAGMAIRACARVTSSALLAACSRASTARMFVATGTAHYAFDLYGEAPRAARGSAILPANRLRSSIGITLVRFLRSRGDFAAMCAYTTLGAGMLAWSSTIAGSVSKAAVVTAGVFALYVGLGSAKEFWRSLRDELALLPLYGGGKFGALRRHIGGLTVIFGCCAILAGALASTAIFIMVGGHDADLAGGFVTGNLAGLLKGSGPGNLSPLFVVLSTALMVIFARIRNATKGMTPLWLLQPLHTPFGDTSGLLLAIWQAEGVLIMGVAAAALILAG